MNTWLMLFLKTVALLSYKVIYDTYLIAMELFLFEDI